MAEDWIYALATPPGRSALALIRLSGPGCLEAIATATGIEVGRQRDHARFRDYVSRDGDKIDFVGISASKGPHTFTGEDLVELTCHGNPLIVKRLLDDLRDRGCRLARPGEFSERRVRNGRQSLVEIEALADLIAAETDAGIKQASKTLNGDKVAHIASQRSTLHDAIARIEVFVDFPGEDIPEEDFAITQELLTGLEEAIARLLGTAPEHRRLQEGVRIVICGPPNAGKSSLLNALVGEDRVLTHGKPGTTRDWIEVRATLGPYPVSLIDTAGLRDSEDEIEAEGVRRSHQQIQEADLRLAVRDATAEGAEPDITLPSPTILVLNKMDLPRTSGPRLPSEQGIAVSALTGAGLPLLQEKILEALQTELPELAPDFLVNERQAQELREAHAAVGLALRGLRDGQSTELIVPELRQAEEAFDRLLGDHLDEAVLDRIFSGFCIGK
jgi:tRNA modification GTPase